MKEPYTHDELRDRLARAKLPYRTTFTELDVDRLIATALYLFDEKKGGDDASRTPDA